MLLHIPVVCVCVRAMCTRSHVCAAAAGGGGRRPSAKKRKRREGGREGGREQSLPFITAKGITRQPFELLVGEGGEERGEGRGEEGGGEGKRSRFSNVAKCSFEAYLCDGGGSSSSSSNMQPEG